MHGRAVSARNDQQISLKKIHYETFKGPVLFHTTYWESFQQNRLRHLIKIGRSPPGFDSDRLKSSGVPERSEERAEH
jgi:hypothetical protein